MMNLQPESDETLLIKFNKAASHLSSLASELPSSDLLCFYSLYKQSTEGPCNIPKPGIFDIKGKQKWEAWKSLKNMTKNEAMMMYIDKLSELEPCWEDCKTTKIGWVSVSRMLPEDDDDDDGDSAIPLFHFVKENNLEKVRQYSPSELKICDENNMTALHWACDRGYDSIVEYLLQRKLNVNSQDIDGQTPLHYAVACGHKSVVELLLIHGANKDIADVNGITPIECAEMDTIRTLLQ